MNYFQVFFQAIPIMTGLIFTENSFKRIILEMSSLITKIFPTTVLVLFCTLAHFISLHLGIIHNRIEDNYLNRKPSSGVLLLQSQRFELKLLQGQHLLACHTIDQLNRFFGLFLAVEVCFIYVGVINSSMFLLVCVMENYRTWSLFSGIILLDHLVHFFLLTTFSSCVTNQVYLLFR